MLIQKTINTLDVTTELLAIQTKKRHDFICASCGCSKTYFSDFTTGYGTDANGAIHCFDCIGETDLQALINAKPGYIKSVCLYYVESENNVTNWPGSLAIKTVNKSKGRHNMARVRYDFDFSIAGCYFHGYVCGNNTLIATVRKLKPAQVKG